MSWCQNRWYYLIAIVVSVAVVYLSVTANRVDDAWYQSLNKPPGVVPNKVFGIVWAVLYTALLVGILVALTRYSGNKSSLLLVYSIVMVLTLLWVVAFANFHMMSVGLLILIVLLVIAIYMTNMVRHTDMKGADWIPLICFAAFTIWIGVATYYNAGFLILNPCKDGK